MTARPIVYIFHTSTASLRLLQRHIRRHDFQCKGYVGFDELYEVPDSSDSLRCVLIAADASALTGIAGQKMKAFLASRRDLPTAFLNSPMSFELARTHFGNIATILSPGTTVPRIIEVVYRLMVSGKMIDARNDSSLRFRLADAGLQLVEVLEFVRGEGLTGSLRVQGASESGTILLMKGAIERATFGDLSGDDALGAMAGQQNPEIHIHQKTLRLQDAQRYATSGTDLKQPSSKDLLGDIFYFMHGYLENRHPLEKIRTVCQTLIGEMSDSRFENIQLVYSTYCQEKLLLFGDIESYHHADFFRLYRDVFRELENDEDGHKFADFLNSLEEIAPYMENLTPFSSYLSGHSPDIAVAS